jgi:TolB protein
MINWRAAFCGLVLAAALAAPASAQIIVGGKPVTPATAPATTDATAPLVLTFPADPDAAGYIPISVAAPVFSGATAAEADLAAKIAELVRADLASIGLFAAPDSASISAFTADIGALPVWTDWSAAGVGALVVGKAIIGADNSLTIQFRVHDIAMRNQIVGKQYKLPSADAWRRAAHKVADDVMVALVGGKPGFDSRIAFILDASGGTELGVIDHDGAQRETVFQSTAGMESPRAAPNNSGFVFSANAPVPGKPSQAQRTTLIHDLATGSRTALTTQAQPNADARYAADGASLIYSRKAGTNTDIYMMPLSSRAEKRLTDDKAVDEQPAPSPDGTLFAFVSDRGGGQGIHVARVDGAPMRCANGSEAATCRLTTAPGEYEGPVWSPRGDLIAFSRVVGEQGALHVVKPDGSDLRAVTSPGRDVLDLHPTWSPEGWRLAFTRVAGSGSAVHIIALQGGQPRKLDLPGDSYEPDWGPKLP